jgi:hypothetical protein
MKHPVLTPPRVQLRDRSRLTFHPNQEAVVLCSPNSEVREASDSALALDRAEVWRLPVSGEDVQVEWVYVDRNRERQPEVTLFLLHDRRGDLARWRVRDHRRKRPRLEDARLIAGQISERTTIVPVSPAQHASQVAVARHIRTTRAPADA